MRILLQCLKSLRALPKPSILKITAAYAFLRQHQCYLPYVAGKCYGAGCGVAQYDAEAVRLWSLSAAQGCASAKINLGNSFRFGQTLSTVFLTFSCYFFVKKRANYYAANFQFSGIQTQTEQYREVDGNTANVLAKYGCEYSIRRGKTLWQTRTRSKHLMFWMFIASYSAVHMNFELQYWLTDERDIFNKYEMAEGQASQLEVAKKVYFTKSSWMFALVTLNAFGLNFRAAMALSFFIYSIELVLFRRGRTPCSTSCLRLAC